MSYKSIYTGFNPDFALRNGIRQKIWLILRQKKVLQYFQVLLHFFHVYYKPSFPSRFVILNARSGFNLIFILFALVAGSWAEDLEYGVPDSFVEIHGVVAQEYYDYANGGENNGIASFDNHYAYLYIDCMLREDLKGMMELKIDHGGSEVIVDRCLIQWKISEFLGINMGKYYHDIFFDIKRYRPSGNRLITPYLTHALFNAMVFRDIGVELFGTYRFGKMKAGYKISVANGSMMNNFLMDENGNVDFNEFTEDTNDDKSLLSVLNFWPVYNLKLAGTYFRTSTDLKLEVNTYVPSGFPGLDILVVTESDMGRTDIEVMGATSQVTFNRFELIFGSLLVDVSASGESLIVINNYLGEVLYRIVNNKNLYVDLISRVTYLESMYKGVFSAPVTEEIYYSLGARISPYKNFTVKTEYRWVEEYDGENVENNGVLFQVAVAF